MTPEDQDTTQKTIENSALRDLLIRCFVSVLLMSFGTSIVYFGHCLGTKPKCHEEAKFMGDTATGVTLAITALLAKLPDSQ